MGVEQRSPIFHTCDKPDRCTVHVIYVGPSCSWDSHNHTISYSWGELNSRSAPEISWGVDPKNSKPPNGVIKFAPLAITFVGKKVDVPGHWKDRGCDFFFDDNPRLLGNGAMWALHLADYNPYNNAYSIDVGVVKVKVRVENGNEIRYKLIEMYTKIA